MAISTIYWLILLAGDLCSPHFFICQQERGGLNVSQNFQKLITPHSIALR
jgi:hypothetical protein